MADDHLGAAYFSRVMSRAIREKPLQTAIWRALLLYESDPPPSSATIAGWFSLPQRSVSRILTLLVERGLAEVVIPRNGRTARRVRAIKPRIRIAAASSHAHH